MNEIEADEQQFRTEMERARESQERVAAWLRGEGYSAEVIPAEIRPDYASRHAYSDNGDVLVWKPGSDKRHKVNVKRRHYAFTCADDYPFPSIYIEDTRLLDDAVVMHVMTNEVMTHAAVIMRSTQVHWTHELTTHRQGHPNNDPHSVTACPTHLARFVVLPDPLLEAKKRAVAAYREHSGDETFRAAAEATKAANGGQWP